MSAVVSRCSCGYGGTRATHRAHLDGLDRKHASLSRLHGIEDVLALVDKARAMVSNCLLADMRRRRDERAAA